MPIRDDMESLEGWIDGVFDEIGWDIPGPDGSGTMADAVIDVVIDGQQARARVQQGPDGRWKDNEGDYRDRKERLYGDSPPNYRTRQMLSRESLKGKPEVGKETTVWDYGTGEAPSGGRTKRDRTRTDIEKAQYAEEDGQSKPEIIRSFFAVTEEDADDAMPVVEDAIAAHLERKAGG